MSYGMMIAVQLDKQVEFKSLWNWAKTYMYHASPTHPGYQYFSWQMKSDGTPNDEFSAPDGEEYFAMALYFAAARWGNGEGIYNYKAEADTLTGALKNRAPITDAVVNPYKASGTGTALFNSTNHQVRFSPDQGNITAEGDFTDPSYHLPAFYTLWSRVAPEADRAFWAAAATASRNYFPTSMDATTGLMPDYSNFDGTAKSVSWNAATADYGHDAHRTIMNIAMDWAWLKGDAREPQLVDRLLGFFAAHPSYVARYTLTGTSKATYTSVGQRAMNAVGSLAATNPEAAKPFVQALWDAAPPSGTYRYYDGMLYTFGLLHVSGIYKPYEPK